MKALLLAAALIAPGQDLAADPTTVRSLRIAGAFWQTWPACAQRVQAARAQDLPDLPANWSMAARVDAGTCDLWVNVTWFDDGTVPRGEQRSYCEAVVHEWGHWVGQPHVAGQTIMNPTLEGYKVPGCRVYRYPKRQQQRSTRRNPNGSSSADTP